MIFKPLCQTFRADFAPLAITPLLLFLIASPGNSAEIEDSWLYTLRQPPANWAAPDFEPLGWREGSGGFGTRETPGARVGTIWATNAIWLRKSFSVEAIPKEPALLIHHDEDAEVFLNGKLIATLRGYTTDYQVVPIGKNVKEALRVGDNLLAVNCRQTAGGQFIDVHLISSDQVPPLPTPKRSTKPFISELITEWGAEVDAENAWTEYPRPQLQRDDWTNLNGHWDYTITPAATETTPEQWTGEILVPYSLESKLGGVQRLLDSSEALWYRRFFELTPATGTRQLLNFEAVDYLAEVFVNGNHVGSHQGGNTPFTIDISDAVQEGVNELIVRVQDETDGWQLRGKQTLNPRGIWYTQVSGIWQTVWLESVPATYVKDLKIKTDPKSETITVRPVIDGFSLPLSTKIVVKDAETVVAKSSSDAPSVTLKIPNAELWSPASPTLYSIEVYLLNETGKVIDRVETYTGIRSVGRSKDRAGHWRFTLNDEYIFHWGPLDQGWWPDGLLTPPSDEAIQFEIAWLKKAGFNMIRKHIKVEPRRYYYHCDRLGMMVWQDHVSGGAQPSWTRLQPNPVDAEWPDSEHRQFMLELDRMITSLENHPSIVMWVPFNERWAQHRTMEVGQWVEQRDPSRLINIASGGNFWPVGDVVDAHRYPHPGFPFEQGAGGRFDDYTKVMGEFGGHGFPVIGHLWDQDRRNWGYGGLPETKDEYKERYLTSLNLLNELRGQGIAGGVYTQTTDVEGEINGLMTYDRKVIKIPAEELSELHERLFDPDSTQGND